MKSPLFIFSLPRSGSTLLQRVLMGHRDVCSLAEPWVLLPQIYALKEEGSLSEYSSVTAYYGIAGFLENLPKKKQDYMDSLSKFMTEIYSKQCKNGETYFLDKTPRYYHIIDEIFELFPDAKFIFLFRNPIHIYASIVNTWGDKRFRKLYSTYYDMINGFKLLSKGFTKHKNKSISLNYEDFIKDPTKELLKISKYLEIEFDDKILEHFSNQDTKGILGDPTGVKTYSSISSEGLNKWEQTFNSFIRKKYAFALMNKIDEEDFKAQNYSKTEILKSIKNLDNKKNGLIFIDLFDYFVSFVVRRTNLYLLVSKNFSWVKKKSFS
ncbi:MAG: sulfotransferase [Gelidibacter sp.]